MAPSVDPAIALRQSTVADVAKVLLTLGVADSRLDVIVRAPGDTLAAVARSENIVFAIDESLPMSWFRERFATLVDRRADSSLTTQALCRTAALLARRARDPARVDRIEFIATRLLTRELSTGQLEALPEAEFFSVLNDLQLGIAVSDDVRDKAVAFFVDAAQKLQAVTSVEQLLRGGLYLELQGYKKSLREKRLDPAVLYACVLVSVAITNHLLRFAVGEGVPHRTLLARVASTEIDAEKILSAAEDARLRRRRLSELAYSARRDPRLFLGAAAVFAAVVLTLGVPPGPTVAVEPLPKHELTATSRLLVDGFLSSGEARAVFIGHVDPAAWAALAADDRRETLKAITVALKAKNAGRVLLYDGDSLVGHMQDGVALYLDPPAAPSRR